MSMETQGVRNLFTEHRLVRPWDNGSEDYDLQTKGLL